jgi:hypothetical protein
MKKHQREPIARKAYKSVICLMLISLFLCCGCPTVQVQPSGGNTIRMAVYSKCIDYLSAQKIQEYQQFAQTERYQDLIKTGQYTESYLAPSNIWYIVADSTLCASNTMSFKLCSVGYARAWQIHQKIADAGTRDYVSAINDFVCNNRVACSVLMQPSSASVRLKYFSGDDVTALISELRRSDYETKQQIMSRDRVGEGLLLFSGIGFSGESDAAVVTVEHFFRAEWIWHVIYLEKEDDGWHVVYDDPLMQS